MPANKYSLPSVLNLFHRFAKNSGISSDSRSKGAVVISRLFSIKNNVENWKIEDISLVSENLELSDQPKQILNTFIQQIPSSLTNLALSEFVLALKEADCSDSTIKNYRSDINQFFDFSKEASIDQLLTKPKIATFIGYQRQKGLKDSSITRKLKSIAQLGLWAEEAGITAEHRSWLHNITIEDVLTKEIAPTVASQVQKPINLGKISSSTKEAANQEASISLSAWSQKIKNQIALRTRNQILPYLNLVLIVLFFIGITIFGYQQLRSESTPALAFPSDVVKPSRVLSFQGRLTDTAQNPITSSTNMRYYLYDALSGGTQLWDSGVCSITPDQDGIFSTGLGDDCGSEISSDVFSENANMWLEVEVASETLTPRQPIRTVPFALNSETVQGFPINASESATANTILVMNEWGEVVLGENSPTIKSISGTFSLEGESLNLQTVLGSNGDITLSPDGTGGVIITSDTTIQGNGILEGYLAAPGATFSATYAGGTSLRLNSGGLNTDVQTWYASDGSRLGRFTETAGGHGWFEVDNNAGTALFLVRADGGASYFNSGNFGFGDTSADAKVNIQSTTEQLRLDYDDSNYSSFTVGSDGRLTIAGTGTDADIVLNPGGSLIFSDLDCTANANGGALTVDASGIVSCTDDDAGSGGTGYWRLTSGAFSPLNDTADLLIGGESTASAKFAFINVNSGTPTASFSGNLAIATPTGANPTTSLDVLNGGTLNIRTSVGGDTGLTSRLFVSNNGNVGIGDSSPASLFTVGNGDLFQVDSTGSIVSIDGVAHTITDVSGDLQLNSAGGQINFANGNTFNIGGVTGQGYNVISDSGTATFASGDNDLYVEDILEVGGTLYVSGNAIDPNALWENTANVYHFANEYGSVADLVIGGTSTASANIRFGANGTVVFNEQGNDADFRVEGDTNVNLLFADASTDRVGIGTNTPATKLNVDGVIRSDRSSVPNQYLEISGGDSAGSVINSVGANKFLSIRSLDTAGTVGSSNGIRFYTNTTAAPIERMRIDYLGNIGIGDTSPDAKLNIQGTTEQLRLDYDDSNYSSFTVGSDGRLTIAGTGTDADIVLNPGGSLIFSDLNCSANANGGALTVDASGIVSCSDDDAGAGGTSYWRLTSGAFSPINDTADLLIGGESTQSAKFAFINVNSGTPTASFSGNLAIATPTGADPSINLDALNGGSFNFRTSVGGDAGSTTRVIIDNQGNLLPGTTNTYNIGSDSSRWANIYLGTSGASFGTSGDAGTIGYNTTADAFNLAFGGAALTIDDVSNRPTFSSSTATAIDFLENLRLSLDSIGVQIGASQDLQLTHDGTNSLVTSFTNNLFLAADDDSTASQIQFGLEDGSTVLGYFVTGTSNRGDFAVDTNTLYVDASSNAVGIGDATPASLFTVGSGDLFQIDSTGSIINIDGVAHSISDVGGDLQLNSAGGQINFTNGNTFNIGGVTGQTYNAISDAGTATYASTDNDLYVEDILEVDGSLYLNGNLIDPNSFWENDANVYHPINEYAGVADLVIGGTSTASASVQFSSQGWGTLTGARTGQALLQLDEEGDQDIFTASASGTTKLRITNNGDLIAGTTNNNNIGEVTNMSTMDQDFDNASLFDASFIGEDSEDDSGFSVSNAGDVNGDGYDDLLIGAYGDEDGGASAGQTYLILGKASGWADDTDLSAADASFIGEDASDNSGYSVSGAGDVNGDGYDDIIIGAYNRTSGTSNQGETYLIFGKATGWAMDTDLSTADASFLGEGSLDFSGWSVSGAGDVNGDGYDDIIIGAHNNDDGASLAGQSYLIFGKSSGWTTDTSLANADASFLGEDIGDQSGRSVSGTGDVNGDGYDDILIGAYGDDDGGSAAGQTYLILGQASGWAMDTDLSAADASYIGEEADDESGKAVSGAGDVNGDGYDDFLIGARTNDAGGSNAGQAYLIFGQESGWTMDVDLSAVDASFIGEEASDVAGDYVSDAGDVNGDGYDDFLIGAYGNDEGTTTAGQSYLFLGKSSGWANDTDLSAADASFIGESGQSGRSLSSAGDANGDGYDDILIGAPANTAGGNNAGQTYLILSDENQFDTILSRHVTAGSSLRAGSLSLSGETLSSTGQLKINSKNISLNQSGDLAITGTLQASTSLGISTDVNINNLLGLLAASGQAGSDLYWGDDLLCDVSAVNCGTTSLWTNTANVFHAAGPEASVADLVIGGDSTASASVQFSSQGWGTLTGARTGQALLQLNETGDQDILAASASGTTKLRITTNGDIIPGSNNSNNIGQVTNMNTLDQSLANADASFIGESGSDFAGATVNSAGDVNGDGYDDFLIGSLSNDDGGSSAGKTYLVFGKASGWSMDTDLSAVDASFIGEEASDFAGAISSAGDVNGDGYDDILIGAYFNDDGGSNAGQTYLILGKASGWTLDQDLSTADAGFIGEDGSDFSGRSVSSAGDINGDGYDDILIGASGDTGGGFGAGKAYVIFGKASGWTLDQDLSTADAGFIGEDTNDNAGYVVSSAGDVNGDGYDDVLISATGDDDGGSAAGQTYLILGKASGWAFSQDLSTADASFIGEEASDNSGISISSAGDVNGDGYDDFLIGANANDAGGSNAGQAYLIFGKASGWAMDVDLSAVDASFIGEEANDNTGRAVSGAGDVNGDGYNDILIGAYASSSGSESYVILGKAAGWSMDTDLSTADASFLSEGDNGARVSGAGDVNGDGYDDILTGVETNDQGGTNAGQTYLVLSDEKQFDTILSRHVTAGSSLRAGALSLIGETLSSTGQLKINSKNISVNQSGDLAITGTLQASNSLGISTDVNINNLLGISAAVGSAGSDLYWGDALICDVSELNCGVSGGLWENTANVIHAAGSEASVVDLVLGGTSTASATVQFSSQGWGTLTGARTGQALLQLNETGDQDIITASASGNTRFRVDTNGYVHAQRFVDIANSAYYLDPAATGTSLTTVGSVGIGTATPVGKFNVIGNVVGKALSIFDYTGTDQDIIVASNSGERRFSVGWDGHATISGSLTIGSGSLHLSDDTNSSTIHSSSGNLNLQVGGIDSGLTGNSSVFFLDNEGTTRGRFDTKANNLDSGDGTDGSLSLTSLLNLNTTDSSASSDDNGTYADGIAYKIDVATASGLTVGTADAPNGLVSGDQVLLINLQGADGDTADAGNYEFLTIYSIEGNEITFNNSIQNSYDGTTPSNQDVVIQRVPQYTDVTLSSSGEITASAWDGLTTTPTGDAGYLTGIVAFRATGTVTVGGGTSINVDELGYRGGTGDANGGPNGESFDGFVGSGGNSDGAAGTSGGGAAGDGVGSTGTRGGGGGGGAGKNAAGGGGGAGGGYGGGGGAGGGGDRNSDNTAGDGGDGGDSNVRGGGGGGGNSSDGVGGDGGNAGSSGTGPGHGAVAATDASTGEGGTGQQSSTNIGGAGGGGGGLYGSSDLSTIFHGSGGGAGGAAGGSAFDGGDGGGTVYISAENLSLTGTISANGGAATASSTSNGGGGGGSGGSIYIQSPNSVNMGSSLITAASNTGQSGSGQSAGGGGGGGVGRIVVATLEESTTTGTTTPTYFESEFFSNYGTFYLGVTNTSSADIAEHYPSDQDLLLGEVVIFDPNKTLHIKRANSAYHQGMIGIISTDPGVILGQGDAKKYGDKTYPVALSGRIPVLISQDSEPIEIGDYLTSSNDPGKAQKATKSGMVVARALEPWEPGDGKKKIMAFAQLETIDVPLSESDLESLQFDPIYEATLSATDASSSATATDSATLIYKPISYHLSTALGETISKAAAFNTAVIGNVRSGLVTTQQLVTNSLSVTSDQITISGVSLNQYIAQQIEKIFNQTPTLNDAQVAKTDLLQPLLSNNLTVQIGSASESGALQIRNENSELVAQIDNKGNTSLLGDLLVGGDASISGTVSTQNLNAKSARLEKLEARLAQLEDIDTQTARIVNATISGTLYADTIDGFQDKVAAALEEPSLLGKLLGQGKTATNSASPSTAANIATTAGFDIPTTATGSALLNSNSLNQNLADLNLSVEDVTLAADAIFINNYFKVNGNSFIAGSLGLGNDLLVDGSIKVGANTYLSDGSISYIPTTAKPSFEIQPSGTGSLSLMAGLLTLDESGQAIVTGDLTVTGNLTVKDTLLTNLLTPVDFTNPLQVQLATRSGSVAGVTTEEVKESRFEIINELGTPVATISAQGKASFESGLGVGAENLTEDSTATTSGVITTTKSTGVATIKAGTKELIIQSPQVTKQTLIYITPLGPTGNQVMYVKGKNQDNPSTPQNEASFTVGFESNANSDIEFNWWIVN